MFKKARTRLMSPFLDVVVIFWFLVAMALLQLGATRAAHEIYDRMVDWIYKT